MSGAFRFFNDNFADVDVVANYYISSEQTPTFPAENAFAERRSRVWRSNGYFDLREGDTTIVFRETIGVDLTATVDPIEYNSTASFMTAVKTALEDIGAGTYSVTQDVSTLKFKIQQTAGSGTFQLRWADAASLDMAAIMGFSGTLTGSLTYTADTLRLHTSEWILCDFGLSSNPTSFALITRRNAAIPISPGAVIKLQGNETNNFSGTPSYEATITYDDEIFSKLSDSGLHTEPLRYWRVYFEDKANPNGYLEVGSFFIGSHYSATRGCARFPFDFDEVDRSERLFSEGGATFSEQKEKTERFSVSWNALTKEEVEEMKVIFGNFGTSRPLFVSFDTNEVFSSDLNRMLKYVKFDQPPRFSLVSPNNFNATTTFLEEI